MPRDAPKISGISAEVRRGRSGKPKILFVINSLEGGGAERVMATLLAHSEDRRDDFDMALALLDDAPQAYDPPDWLPIYRASAQGSLLASLRGLYRICRRFEPDVTLSFLTRSNIANVLINRFLGRPAIISERVHTAAHLGTSISKLPARLMVRGVYPRATRVLAVSAGVADDLVSRFGVDAGRTGVIFNPLDKARIKALAAEPSPLRLDSPYILAMGRLVENKNFALLVDAYARADLARPLVILGQGPLRGALEAQIERLGLAGRVLLSGFLENPFPLLVWAHCFVLPSNAEGFPNSLAEAMALGVPVVSTDCQSGPSEILACRPRRPVTSAEKAGFGILTPCDDVASLAHALTLLEQPDLHQHYSEQARVRAAAFDPIRAASAYWREIDAVLHGHQQRISAEA